MSMIKEMVVTPLTECSIDTGYSFEFLAELVNEIVQDRGSYQRAVQDVMEMAYERDLDE